MNSHGDHQRPSVSVQSAAPSDPRIRVASNISSDSHPDVCRKYVWGICKHGQCRFRHDCTVEEMKNIIIFCHNYQNRNGCNLPNCTYLHTSKEEETLFRTTGRMPRVLMERHAAMRAAAAGNTAAHMNVPMTDSVPPMFITHPGPLPPTILPPPPPPPPPTESSVIKPAPTVIFTAPPPTRIPLNQPPPPLPPNFDASVPPPSIKCNNLKRSINDICEAGPSKLRKAEDGKAADNMCEKCVQRELSSDMYRMEIEQRNRKMEDKRLIFKSKSEETEKLRTMMRLLLPLDMCLAIEEYMDEQLSSTRRLSMQSSSVMKEMLLSLLINSPSERTLSPELPADILSADITRTTASILTSMNGSSQLLNELDGKVPHLPPHIPPPPVSQRAAGPSTPAFAPYQPGVAPYQPAVAPYQPGVPPPPFQPGVPPPPLRAACPPAYVPGPVPAARPPAPPASAPPALPANGHYTPYVLGGYSSHQYYPPYQ